MLSFAILVSAVFVLSCGQTDRITKVDDRYTHATTVDVSKDCATTGFDCLFTCFSRNK